MAKTEKSERFNNVPFLPSKMLRPILRDFELSESEYQAYVELPKRIKARLLHLGAILGALLVFILCYARSKNLLLSLVLAAWFGVIAGSIVFSFLNIFLVDFFVCRHKLHSRATLYEAALLAYQRTQESFWKALSGKEFERQLGHLFSLQGYNVEFTPASGDQGVDLVLARGTIKTIVQCKAHSKPVGPGVARDLYGALIASRAQSAILASTSGFTRGVYSFSEGKRIELLSLQDIIRLSEEVSQAETVKPIRKKS
jgi:restriction system protein